VVKPLFTDVQSLAGITPELCNAIRTELLQKAGSFNLPNDEVRIVSSVFAGSDPDTDISRGGLLYRLYENGGQRIALSYRKLGPMVRMLWL
jgi:hypothetical protein